jgi:uncharacterized protein
MAKYLILACDGGGIRGYISASVLRRLVEEPGVGDFLPQVSLRAGTSTGSFIALALARGVDIRVIQEAYQQPTAKQFFLRNPEITGRSATEDENPFQRIRAEASEAWHHLSKYYEDLVNVQYLHDGVAKVARSLLGDTTKLSDLAPVMVNTLRLADTGVAPSAWMPAALGNLDGSAVSSMYAWEAALCSGAAPIYFPPYRPESADLGYCVDGGLYANNPSLSAVVAALAQGASLGELYLLSFDTGTTYESMPPQVIDQRWGGPLRMGPLAWLFPETVTTGAAVTPKFPLLASLMDAGAAEIAANAELLLGHRYMRVCVPLTGPVMLDDTSDTSYETMNASLASFFGSPAYAALTGWLQAHFPC